MAATSLVHHAGQRFHVQHAAIVRGDVDHFVTGHAYGSRIGPVRRIGNDDLLARIPLRFEHRADQQDPGELAVRTGGGLQRHRVHAGDLGQRPFELGQNRECALR